jgi:hypothetical protein
MVEYAANISLILPLSSKKLVLKLGIEELNYTSECYYVLFVAPNHVSP